MARQQIVTHDQAALFPKEPPNVPLHDPRRAVADGGGGDALELPMTISLLLVAVLTAEPITEDKVESYYAEAKERGAAEHPTLVFRAMKVGDIGIFPYAFDPAKPTSFCNTKIHSITGPASLVLEVQAYYIERKTFRSTAGDDIGRPAHQWTGQVSHVLIAGISTQGQIDGGFVQLPGGFKVTGTRKAPAPGDEKTMYVLEPFRLPKLK
jgi:hypothetical protein